MDASNAIFDNATIKNSIFTALNAPQVSMIGTTIDWTDLGEAQLQSSDLREVIIQGSNFASANLSNSEFKDSDITNTNFTRTQLGFSDFTGSTIKKVTFLNTGLTAANMTDATVKFINQNKDNAFLAYLGCG